MFKNIGPGVLVAAAFIGPGTVTVCTLAGAGYGFSLLWALLLAVIATIILQEMSARLGIVSRLGLADTIKMQIFTPWLRYLILGIVLTAIVLGNTAYEAGNIGGATLGLEALFGEEFSAWFPYIIGLAAFTLLWIGSYKTLERVFVGLVLLMSMSFLITSLLTRPDWGEVLQGLFLPDIPSGGLLTVVALVGTTVVPYNLFLHASLVATKWKSSAELAAARRDTYISISLGGVVSMAIVVSAAAIPSGEITGAIDLAKSLEPLYGQWALYFMGIGLFAAGVTSAITAPLAAAYVANSCFGWGAGLTDLRFRLVWFVVLLVGVISLSFGVNPIEVIQFAQVANGLLLPIIAVFLLWVLNDRKLMGTYANSGIQNLLGALIIMLAVLLGARIILKVFGII